MRSGAPTNSLSSPPNIAVNQKLFGASYCWESSIIQNAIATTGHSEITPLRTSLKTPLGLSLYAPKSLCPELTSGPFSTRHLIDGLLSEIAIRAHDTGKRKAPWLHWKIPHALLDSADVMELMHLIGKQFQLGDNKTCHYSVCFSFDELETQRAALFKGLGFNSLELELKLNTETAVNNVGEQLKKAGAICQDYHYPHFAIRMNRCSVSLITALTDLQKTQHRLPDCINIDPCKFTSSGDYQKIFSGLKGLGYRVLGNDCFVRPGTALANAQIDYHLRLSTQGYNCQNVVDIVGLGPGNHSSLNHTRYQNSVELPNYLANPQGDRFMISALDTRIKLVIDHLLCYHQLDLKYFEDRYGLNLSAALDNAWGPLDKSPHVLRNKNQLRLTAQGILELTPLCQSLINHYCAI